MYMKKVFIRYNKNDLSEKYVCTLFNSTAPNGLGTEPTCFSSEVYNNKTQPNSEWSKMQILFGSTNCSDSSSFTGCHVTIGSAGWTCHLTSSDTTCSRGTQEGYAYCAVLSSGSVMCG